MNTPHKHAALMLQYAQDAAETDRPWERWEYLAEDDEWYGCTIHPSWIPEYEYRHKPRTININGHEVPEPMRVAPESGSIFYVAHLMNRGCSAEIYWCGHESDHRWLERGLCHATREAAGTHAKALLSFTENNQ